MIDTGRHLLAVSPPGGHSIANHSLSMSCKPKVLYDMIPDLYPACRSGKIPPWLSNHACGSGECL